MGLIAFQNTLEMMKNKPLQSSYFYLWSILEIEDVFLYMKL